MKQKLLDWAQKVLFLLVWSLSTSLGWWVVISINALTLFSAGIYDPDEVATYLAQSPALRALEVLLPALIGGLVFGVIVGTLQWYSGGHKFKPALLAGGLTLLTALLSCQLSSTGPSVTSTPLELAARTGAAGGLLGGILAALFQKLLLRRHILQMMGWVWFTALGWLLAGGILTIADTLSPSGLMAAAAGVLAGTVIGAAQWIILRRTILVAAWWVLYSAICWGAAAVVQWLINGQVSGTFIGLIAGLAFAVIILVLEHKLNTLSARLPDLED
jgi:hypothetical protein